MTIDPDTLRRQLEQQARLLAPIAARLGDAAAHPPIAPADWHGPASTGYGALEERLRHRVVAAEHAVTAALQSTRAALAQLPAPFVEAGR